MSGKLRMVLAAAVVALASAASAHAASLPTSPSSPTTKVPKYKGPPKACTLVQTSAGFYNPCTGVTIPYFG